MRFLTHWLPVLLWLALILGASDDALSGSTTQAWLDRILGRPIPPVVNVAIRKTAHLIEYAILAGLSWRALTRARLEGALLIAVAVAALDEYRQALTLTRTGTPSDVAIDLAGALLGVLAGRFLENRRRTVSATDDGLGSG